MRISMQRCVCARMLGDPMMIAMECFGFGERVGDIRVVDERYWSMR